MLYGHRALMLVQQELRERNKEWEKREISQIEQAAAITVFAKCSHLLAIAIATTTTARSHNSSAN